MGVGSGRCLCRAQRGCTPIEVCVGLASSPRRGTAQPGPAATWDSITKTEIPFSKSIQCTFSPLTFFAIFKFVVSKSGFAKFSKVDLLITRYTLTLKYVVFYFLKYLPD